MNHITGNDKEKSQRMYLISYDISDNRCRNKIAKKMEGYGKRVQYSVFECFLTKALYTRLLEELADLMRDQPEGSIRVYYICENCRQKLLQIGESEDHPRQDEEDTETFVI